MSRRGLLRMAMFAAAGSAAGCGDSGSVNKVETPTVSVGNRKRLDSMQDKASEAAAKKKKR